MKKYLMFMLLIAGLGGIAKADSPAVHGMVLFGDGVSYASHLPMFHSPHDYQVLLKVSLQSVNSASDTNSKYLQLKAKGETYFTLAPEKMDLSLIVNETKKSFLANLFQGHFEKGGFNLGQVVVNIDKLIFAEKLKPKQEIQPIGTEYLIFGESNEFFALHLIKSKPSFDQILNVTKPKVLVDKNCRARSCGIHEFPFIDVQLPITLKDPLSALPATINDILSLSENMIFKSKITSVEVTGQVYLEEDELAH